MALDKWGTNTRIFSPLIEVESYFVENPDATLPIVLIGNVFKDLSLRPSVRYSYVCKIEESNYVLVGIDRRERI